MKGKQFSSNLDKAISSNKTLSLMVYLIGGLVLYNTYAIQDMPNKERTILIPTGLDRKVWLVGDKASDEYMKATARDIVGLALNYTPANVKANFNELLTYYGPQQFEQARATYYALEQQIVTSGLTSAFYIKDYKLDDNKSTMELIGLRTIFKQGVDPILNDVAYVLKFQIKNGKFNIVELYEKKNEPAAQNPAK